MNVDAYRKGLLAIEAMLSGESGVTRPKPTL
jgi:hypothetical protein